MPKEFDKMVEKIWSGLRGKINPRTRKPFTRSDAYAIATSRWKKSHKGKAPSRRNNALETVFNFVQELRKHRGKMKKGGGRTCTK